MEPILHELKNGLRIVFHPSEKTDVAHCALMMHAGTRNEEKGQDGLAHFIEHMMFKGTEKRKSFHILNRLEVVGGELNAFTSKEETCVHASFLNTYFERAVELMDDIVFHATFPEKELEKEKEVVCDEIRMYLDNPGEQIFDDFEGLIFKHNTLGHSILGNETTVRSFKSFHLKKFTKTNYQPHNIVFSVTGNFEAKNVIAVAEKYFSNYKSTSKINKAAVGKYKTVTQQIKKPTAQCHFVMGRTAHSLHHKDRMKMVLLNNILGGPGMNSRLNLGVREKYGYTYSIESGFNSYSDTGTFHVYLATDKKFVDKSIALAKKELQKLRTQKISTVQMHQYKEQLKGQLALARENKSSVMISSAKSMLNFNKPFNMTEVYKKIDAITAPDLIMVAGDYFNSTYFSSLMYEAEKRD